MPKQNLSWFIKDFKVFFLVSIFVFAETFYFAERSTIGQILFVFIYFWLLILRFVSINKSVFLFLVFTLTARGIGNFIDNDFVNCGFLNLRIFGGLSLNSLFTLIYVPTNPIKRRLRTFIPFFLFFALLLIIGLSRLLLGLNYFDNFRSDLLLYSFLIVYPLVIIRLEKESLKSLLAFSVVLSFVMTLIDLILGNRLMYGEFYSLPINSLYLYILPLIFFINVSNNLRISLFFSLFVLYAAGFLFTSTKFLIISILFFILVLFTSKIKSVKYYFIGCCFILLYGQSFLSNEFVETKLYQFQEVEDLQASNKSSSLVNIYSEFVEYSNNVKNRGIIFSIFGTGLGGTISEYEGLLTPWTKLYGYAEIDSNRNSFYKMHLGLLEMLVKGGVFAFFFYFYLFRNSIKDPLSLFLLIALGVFSFYVSKESILFFVLLFILNINEAKSTNLPGATI